MALLSVLIVFVYVLLIFKFIRGWMDMPEFRADNRERPVKVDIVVPCKNEAANLPLLLTSLEQQSYKNFEVVAVDDHSSDEGRMILEERKKSFPNLKILTNEGFGKKQAVKTAILQSGAELVITLDADCRLAEGWLNEIVQFYVQNPSDLIICPVKINSDRSFFQEFQQVEFTSLIVSGAGATAAGMPILCNGANLAFRREAWMESLSELHFEEQSGDDIFLLQSIKKRKGVIHFLKSKKATVTTQPSESIGSFLRQRRRWASKKNAYTDWQLAFTALTVFLTNLTILVNAFYLLWKPGNYPLFLLIFFLKLTIDIYLFVRASDFFDLKNVIRNSFLFSLVYPFYIITVAVKSVVGQKKW